MTQRPAPRPMLIGHRGASGYRPEHTREAYLLAFEQGVDAVEPDIVLSRDGELVIRHENEISGTTDVAEHPEFAHLHTTKIIDGVSLTGWFTEDFTWEELATLRCRERISELRPLNTRFDGQLQMLRLRDLLALVDSESARLGREIGVVIEMKPVQHFLEAGFDMVGLLLAELARTGWDRRRSRLTIECFELDPLDSLRDAGVHAQLVFLMESRGAPADEVARRGRRARPYEWFRTDEGLESLTGRVHGISLAKRDLFQVRRGRIVGMNDVVKRAHARGLKVFVWTMRPENSFLAPRFRRGSERGAWGGWEREWRMILETGVDGVFLDHPDLLARVLDS